MLEAYVKKILSSDVYDVAIETPLETASFLSARLDANILFKREDLQPIHSFKIRGAYNRIVKLSLQERERGVLAASAGNHAQGVALAASQLGIHATIVMGLNTPAIKVDAVQRLGAEVVLRGDTYDDAAQHALTLAHDDGATLVPPYDDPAVIAGQGTVGVEILNQHEGDPDAIFVPVGGGGLIAGIAAYVKYLKPRVKIIGVEASGSDCLNQALIAGRRVRLRTEGMDLFADGASVAQVGNRPFQIARHHVDQVIVVTTDEICAAIRDIFDDTRAIAEPAGALAVAGLKRYVEETRGSRRSYVAVISGSNVNFDRLRHIS
ncbi:MAG: threonine ammonia-lyase, biosynthetic, partial [Pseudomonadota bacterium]|nr:threonine ammonia-lyase, biosynthetic [Pseudomonadota bacterium]